MASKSSIRFITSSRGRRAVALDHSSVYRDWKLPEIFGHLRQLLEAKHGQRTGVRHFVRVLQLLANHPLERVADAARHCVTRGVVNAEAIAGRVDQMAVHAPSRCPESSPSDSSSAGSLISAVQVPMPDLSRFNQLLS